MESSTLPYLLHCRERDVQVAHSSLRKPFHGLTLFEERKTSAGLLTGISYLQRDMVSLCCVLARIYRFCAGSSHLNLQHVFHPQVAFVKHARTSF